MNFFKFLLMPFSVLHWAVTSFRNYLYDRGHRKSFHFEIKTICVGNLTVGGTGKTPMVEYLVNLLSNNFKVAILSRGYGRKSKGFILAHAGVSVNDLGDEPFQYFLKFKNKVSVAVGEQRVLAIPSILLEEPTTDVILLDDAFQHRPVVCDINIVITDFNQLFFNDFLMPYGRLREWRSGMQRATIALVSKCPDSLNEIQKKAIELGIKKYAINDIPIYFTKVVYGIPQKVFDNPSIEFKKNIILITGIAKPEPFYQYISSHFTLVDFQQYGDHHDYTSTDIHNLKNIFEKYQKEELCIVMSEKDMVKFRNHQEKSIISNLPIFYIPIAIEFLSKKIEFDEYILNYMSKNNY